MNNDSKTPPSRKTGAGAEAAQGVHGASDLEGRTSASDNAGDRKGSEPLEGRTDEHVSGYGGKGGAPRTSSDTREPQSADPGTPQR